MTRFITGNWIKLCKTQSKVIMYFTGRYMLIVGNGIRSNGITLLHWICYFDLKLASWAAMLSLKAESFFNFQIECLRRLLSCGLNVDAGDVRYKRTIAHIAAFAGHPHMLLWVLRAGADPNKQVTSCNAFAYFLLCQNNGNHRNIVS